MFKITQRTTMTVSEGTLREALANQSTTSYNAIHRLTAILGHPALQFNRLDIAHQAGDPYTKDNARIPRHTLQELRNDLHRMHEVVDRVIKGGPP